MLGHCTTLGGMFDITTETPSVINHNKTICSAENQHNDTTRGTGDQKTIFYQMYFIYTVNVDMEFCHFQSQQTAHSRVICFVNVTSD